MLFFSERTLHRKLFSCALACPKRPTVSVPAPRAKPGGEFLSQPAEAARSLPNLQSLHRLCPDCATRAPPKTLKSSLWLETNRARQSKKKRTKLFAGERCS